MKPSNLNISPVSKEMANALREKLDQKAKPIRSLGKMEDIALRIGLIQNTLTPQLNKPTMFTVASDHHVCEEGVSPCPTKMTWQQCLNFLELGGGIGLFCKMYGFDLKVVDAGVDFDFAPHPRLINAKVRKGSRNILHEHAMTMKECMEAIENGRKMVRESAKEGVNVVGFGEMGIGNTTPASALLSIFTKTDIKDCVGPGSGLDSNGVSHKANVITQAFEKHGISEDPIENLARFGGLEIATICGGMLEAAAQKMVIITDGFITTSALLVASEIYKEVLDYAFFSHQSDEQGHCLMIDHMQGEPILNMSFRLGEGTGAACCYPIIKGSVTMLNEMTTFEEAQVFNTATAKVAAFESH
ncbi:nicotinate-nucleotide--dimethylbenzimidazole phosphoribosyltransferase [Halosquirtibacter laminarini]|uniref:Nicotinate-nucleotide--dimethylbenzimidazole phosphoribosyltransferase n=1 Tax=Halosquirtibacter laminarini TaxID=3374600 RepID=A0AC61NJD8_9BACT|nr:nicotinate-nucleotide--dimethylbenzimidazole phosphoribosyltransferase [Prolixibacteraceae bacterium]